MPGVASNNIVNYNNGSFVFNSGWNEVIRCLAEEKHPLLQLSLPTEAEMLPLLNHFTANRGSLTNVMAWNYELVGDAASNQPMLRKKLVVRYEVLRRYFKRLKFELSNICKGREQYS